tara:strand:+ start:3111 stop:3503 length:393 start_codon:yes stop_codon:yes gene_type:complete
MSGFGIMSLFGRKRKARKSRKSPGRKPRRGAVKKLSKSMAYIVVGGRKRKLYKGHNGGLYYRTRSGRHYVPKSVLRRKGHLLSPKKRRVRRARKALRRRKARKLKQTKSAKAARAAYRRRKARLSRFGLY